MKSQSRGRKAIDDFQFRLQKRLDYISADEKRKKPNSSPVKGKRAQFIERYKEVGYKEARHEINLGFEHEVFKDKDLVKWICIDIYGFDPEERLLNSFRQTNNMESAYKVADEINNRIGIDAYTMQIVDSIIDAEIEKQQKGYQNRDDDDDAR